MLWTELCPSCPPASSLYVDVLIFNVIVFGNRTFQGVIKLNEVIGWGPSLMGLVSIQEEEETPGVCCTEERPRENTDRR